MAKYLISTSEIYRVSTEEEVNALIDEAKNNTQYDLVKYDCTAKEKRVKGEIEDSWFRVQLKKVFTEEKDPTAEYEVHYTVKEFEADF